MHLVPMSTESSIKSNQFNKEQEMKDIELILLIHGLLNLKEDNGTWELCELVKQKINSHLTQKHYGVKYIKSELSKEQDANNN